MVLAEVLQSYQELNEDERDIEEELDQVMPLITLQKCFQLINEGEMSSDEDGNISDN